MSVGPSLDDLKIERDERAPRQGGIAVGIIAFIVIGLIVGAVLFWAGRSKPLEVETVVFM